MHPKDAAGIANSVDPDQTAPLGAVWSGSALFAQTSLSENLGTLRYYSVTDSHLIPRTKVFNLSWYRQELKLKKKEENP